eukprot:1236187-Heterocapsa_arctica.AAC.1
MAASSSSTARRPRRPAAPALTAIRNLGINGFGPVGRMILRTALNNAGISLKAINDPDMDLNCMADLTKFDPVH